MALTEGTNPKPIRKTTEAFKNIATPFTSSPEYKVGNNPLIPQQDVLDLSKNNNLSAHQRSGFDYLNYWYSQPEARKRTDKLFGAGHQYNVPGGIEDAVNSVYDEHKHRDMVNRNTRGTYYPSENKFYVRYPNSYQGGSTTLHEYLHRTGMDSMFNKHIPQPDRVNERMTQDRYNYLTNGKEVYPRIMQLRFRHRLKNDGVPISAQQVQDMRKQNDLDRMNTDKARTGNENTGFHDNSLFDIYSNEAISEMLNKLVSNNKPSDGSMYAKRGAKLIRKHQKGSIIESAYEFMTQYAPNTTRSAETTVGNHDVETGNFGSFIKPGEKRNCRKGSSCQTMSSTMHNQVINDGTKPHAWTTKVMEQLDNNANFTKHEMFADSTDHGLQASIDKLDLIKPNTYMYGYRTKPLEGTGNHVRNIFSTNDSTYMLEDGFENKNIERLSISNKNLNAVSNMLKKGLTPIEINKKTKMNPTEINFLSRLLNDTNIFYKYNL